MSMDSDRQCVRRCLSPFHWLLLAFLVMLPDFATALHPPTQDSPFLISVRVDSVVLRATVTNHQNVLISGLERGDFQVVEDGVAQKINHFSHEDIPVTVGLVMDNSGSMGPKRSAVVAAALAFARASNPEDETFVVNFNDTVSLALPVGTRFTSKVAELETALGKVRAVGQTALYDAIDAALDHLAKGTRDKKVLIIISDGGDNASKNKLDAILAKAKRSEAILYSIGIFDEGDGDRNPGVLKRFAEATGGEMYLPATAQESVPICERIAKDIRSQYTIAYTPTNPGTDGGYRVVRVGASSKGRGRLVVRTRAGYFAPSMAPAPPATGGQHPLR